MRFQKNPNGPHAGIEAKHDPAENSVQSVAYFQRKAELDDAQRRNELETLSIRREMEANERHELEARERRQKEGEETCL